MKLVASGLTRKTRHFANAGTKTKYMIIFVVLVTIRTEIYRAERSRKVTEKR